MKKFRKKMRNSNSLIVSKKWDLLLWIDFLSHVRRFGCVENEVLGTYGKSW